MNNKFILMSAMLLIVATAFASADCTVGQNGIDVYVMNNTLIVEGYTCVGIQNYNPISGQYITTPQKFTSTTNSLFISRVNESIGASVYCNSVNITEGNSTNTYYQNCSYSSNYHKEIPFLGVISNNTNQSQPTITDTATQAKYEQCLNDKAQYIAGLNLCTESKNALADTSANYTTCSTNLIQCNADRGVAQSERDTLKTEAEEKKNQGWMWGIAGCILGIVGALMYVGRLGGPRVKTADERYNRNQSG